MLTFRSITLLLFLSASLNSLSQTNNEQCIQIIVKDANTLEKAQSIDAFIRTKNGVTLTRMDRRTGLFMAIYDPTLNPTPETFLAWIQELGFTTLCFEVFEYGNGASIRKLSREDCLKNENPTD